LEPLSSFYTIELILFEEVRFVPNLITLYSLVNLKMKKHVFNGEWGMLKVIRGFMVMMKDVRKNSLYVLEDAIVSGLVYTLEKIVLSKAEICHKMLGRVNKKDLVELRAITKLTN